MLRLEALSDFMAIGWGIQVCERNALENSDKKQVKNQEAHNIETFKIKCYPKDVKTNTNMVNVDTLKQVSPTNLHVSEVTHQVLGITNSVSKVQYLKLQILEVQVSKV